MADMTSQELYNWLVSKNGFVAKTNYRESTSNPNDTPSQNFIIHNNTTTKTIWTWNGSEWKEGLGGSGNGGKYIAKSSDFEIEKFAIYICDVTSNSINATFKTTTPAYVPTFGDWFEVYCPFGDSSSKNITINFMGASFKLNGDSASNFIMDFNTSFRFIYVGGTIGWKPILVELDDLYFDKEEYEIKNTSFYVANNTTYLVDTSTTVVNANVPANITYPFRFKIIDMKNTTSSRYITVNFTTNGYKLEGVSTNDRIYFSGTSCDYLAVDSTYGFKKIETKSNKIDNYSYIKGYNSGDRCYWGGILAEANNNISYAKGFTWGTTGETWKPINVMGNWKGVYSSTKSYTSGDLVVSHDSSFTIYKLQGVIDPTSIGDTSYNPTSGANRNKWYPINLQTGEWALGATSTENGQQGLVPCPQKGDQDKFLSGGMGYVSPYIVGEIKSVATYNTPSGWLDCNGAIVSRTTYADLYNALTFKDIAIPSSNSKIVTCTDTSKLCAGMVVEFNSGSWGYTIATIDSTTTYSLDIPYADMSGSQEVRYFAFGNGGNGTRDLFNLPNMQGKTIIGNGQGGLDINFVSANINVSTNIIAIPTNKSLFTGTTVKVITNGTIPTGLTNNGTYYIIKVSDTTIKLATSLNNALDGNSVDITGQGVGNHILRVTYSPNKLGEIGGEEKHSQTSNELVPHNHAFTNTYGVQYTKDGWGDTQSSTDEISRAEWTANTGGGQPFNIMQPYMTLRYIIKY